MSLSTHLDELTQRHRRLEAQIERETLSPAGDDLVIADLKKRKLRLKEEIRRLSSETGALA